MAALRPDISGLVPNRACRNCVQIKAKCVPQADLIATTICQRCHRLGKECKTPAAIPRKRIRPKIIITSGNEFVHQSLTPVSLQEPCSADTAFSQNPTEVPAHIEPVVPNAHEHYHRGTIQSTSNIFDISPEIGHSFVTPAHNVLFDYFTVHMNEHFPFVTFPSTSSSATVAASRPFLYCCCVMNAAFHDPPMQTRIARDLLRYVSDRMLLMGEKSFDLLQGLLVLVTWYGIATFSQPQLMNLLHLAKALLLDLGLNRASDYGLSAVKMSGSVSQSTHGVSSSFHRTHEERRACLAVYHIHNQYMRAFNRLDPSPWTPYLEECLVLLDENPEYERDALIVAMSRLDQIHERYNREESIRPGNVIPIATYVGFVTRDLDTFTASLPIPSKLNNSLAAQITGVRISLFETILTARSGEPVQRVEAMHLCLTSTLDLFTALVAQDHENISSMSFLTWCRMAHALEVLIRLSFTSVDGWDLTYVRNTPGFPNILDMLRDRMLEVQACEETRHLHNKSIRFKMLAHRLVLFKQWYEKKIEAEASDSTFPRPFLDSCVDVGLPDLPPWFGEFSDLLWQDISNLPTSEGNFGLPTG